MSLYRGVLNFFVFYWVRGFVGCFLVLVLFFDVFVEFLCCLIFVWELFVLGSWVDILVYLIEGEIVCVNGVVFLINCDFVIFFGWFI